MLRVSARQVPTTKSDKSARKRNIAVGGSKGKFVMRDMAFGERRDDPDAVMADGRSSTAKSF